MNGVPWDHSLVKDWNVKISVISMLMTQMVVEKAKADF